MAERKHDDRLLDEYLRGDSTLARVYRAGASDAPPAALDASILAQARNEHAPRRGGKPRWFMPLSLAATVVLSVGVVLFMARQGAGPLPPEAPDTKAPAPVVTPKTVVVPKDAPAVTPKETPRFEPRVFTPKEMPAVKTPEQWLGEIEALRRRGRHAEADAQLAEFRKRHPDYPLKSAVH